MNIIKRYQLKNNVLDLKKSNYEEVLNTFIIKMRQFKEILSIYQLGEVGVPGCSDLDLIVIVSNYSNFKNIKKAEDIIIFENKTIFLHGVWHFTPEVFKNLYLLVPIFSLKKVYGQEFDITKFSDIKTSTLHLTSVINSTGIQPYFGYFMKNKPVLTAKYEILFDLFFPKLFDKFQSKIVDERDLLNKLSSSKYETRLLKMIFQNKNINTNKKILEFDRYHDACNKLRKTWESKKNKINELDIKVRQNINRTLHLIDLFKTFLSKNIVKINGPNSVVLINYPRQNIYLKNWSQEISRSLIKEYYKKSGRIVSVLPMEFLVQILYSKNINKLIRPNVLQKIKFDHKFKDLILQRNNIIIEFENYLKIKGVTSVNLGKISQPNSKTKLINNLINFQISHSKLLK